MCLTRGCENVFDNHGDTRNITMEDLQTAANTAGITVPEAMRNIQKGVSNALRGMTDWTGAQESGESIVLDNYAEQSTGGPQLSSEVPPPATGERSPYS